MNAGPHSRVAGSAAVSWLVRLRRMAASLLPVADRAGSDVGAILAGLAREMGRTDLRVIDRTLPGSNAAIAVLGSRSNAPEYVAKVARSDVTAEELRAETVALAALGEDPRLKPLSGRFPAQVMSGEVGGRPYLVQTHLGGSAGRTADRSDLEPVRAMECAAGLARELHQATSFTTTLTDEDVSRIVRYRVDAAIRRGRLTIARRHREPLEHLVAELHQSLIGRRCRVSWIHGDLWLGNLMVDGSGAGCGLIDWGGIQFAGLPGIDIAHLILTTRAFVAGRELGAVVADAIAVPSWSDTEKALLTSSDDLGVDESSHRTLVLLSWLHHVTSLAPHWSGSAGRWLWTSRNVDTVLGDL